MEKDIDRIPKNPDTDIIIRIDDFGGKRGVTIREFVKSERYTGFTKAGTRIPVEHFKAFKEAINSINEKELMENLQAPTPINSASQTIPPQNFKSSKPQTQAPEKEFPSRTQKPQYQEPSEDIEDIGEEAI